MMPTAHLMSLSRFVRLRVAAFAVLVVGIAYLAACAGAPPAVPKTPTETLYTVETGVKNALATASQLYQAKVITAADARAVETQTDSIDAGVTAASGLLALDPQACAWMVQAVKPAPAGQAPPPAPTPGQVANCQAAMDKLLAAEQQLATLQQGLNSKQGGAH